MTIMPMALNKIILYYKNKLFKYQPNLTHILIIIYFIIYK